ncbi:hypothetical protein Syun_001095 [Stephania yunnanensis]|uniref:Uncharacterized protein n=1 Tax=Stephania yunnanensis TaxID=152371 RepID=A0AAP0Q658_9MAGN
MPSPRLLRQIRRCSLKSPRSQPVIRSPSSTLTSLPSSALTSLPSSALTSPPSALTLTRSSLSTTSILTSLSSESQFYFSNHLSAEKKMKYREYWAFVDFKAKFEKASQNRKNKKGGLGTGPSKHTGGTWSFWTYEDILALDKDEDDEVTPKDVFLHVHTKDHDGTEHGRVYGLGSLAKRKTRYENPGASTSLEPMVQRSELDAVVQRLAQFEAFMQSQLGMRLDLGASTFQKHRHHLKSIISRLGWIRLVHHSSSTTMMMKTTLFA